MTDDGLYCKQKASMVDAKMSRPEKKGEKDAESHSVGCSGAAKKESTTVHALLHSLKQ